MTSEEKWSIIHAYRRKAMLGLLSPIVCYVDGMELLPQVGAGDDPEPVLLCLACNSHTRMGLSKWEELKRAVENN